MNEERRIDDVLVAQLSQGFKDFVERYDRDCGATNEWRRVTELEIKRHGEILNEISPAYTKGKWIAALIAMGSVGIAVKSFWSHLKWQ